MVIVKYLDESGQKCIFVAWVMLNGQMAQSIIDSWKYIYLGVTRAILVLEVIVALFLFVNSQETSSN